MVSEAVSAPRFSKLMALNGESENSIVFPELEKERVDHLELKVGGNDGFYKVLYERARFDNLLQRLEGISVAIEKDRNGIRKEIDKEFEKIKQSLQNRKEMLLKELEFMVQQHLNGITKLQKALKEKINGLDSVIKVAMEAKSTSLITCFNSQQIIEDLKCLDQANNIVEALEGTDLRIDTTLKKLESDVVTYTCVSDLNQYVRKLTPQMKALNHIPPLAIKCSLKDIVPANLSNSWDVEARTEFTRIVDNKVVQMIVLGEDGDKLLVDLKKPPMDKMESDVPVSLRDALVFLELARFVSEYSVPAPNLESNMLLMQYYPPVRPPFLKEIQMMVTHINNPLDFYIQLLDTVDLLILTRNMFEFYTGKDVNLEILCPVVGQACAALFDDGGWYRCQINGLPGHREIDVKYVDYGNTARIPVTNIRKLKEDFLTLPIQALLCRLSDVEPIDSTDGWNDCAKERFQQLTLNKCLWCITCESHGNTLSLQLYESIADIHGTKPCINNMLVEENMACFTKNLQEEMKVVYSTLEQEVVEWEENMDCALLVFEHREWRRGKVTKVISDKFVEVFCYDFGNKETVSICLIRQLKKEFQFGPLALECSLSCIRPAGGSSNWTATSCDFLGEILVGSSVLVNVEETSSKSPLQVKLYAKDEIGQFINIAQYLVKKGLALPQKM
ncbi:hypothetical protein scyTo_0007318 [Scyliorhinus torazame]|uniref:Tudor domain-containing protein n=1 Tax=Scyliorhinus torazame TaxID=75743 RepID=A0A401NQ54_SCYTO|nr:hypothetical protein [Scyliorhinus torazame]